MDLLDLDACHQILLVLNRVEWKTATQIIEDAQKKFGDENRVDLGGVVSRLEALKKAQFIELDFKIKIEREARLPVYSAKLTDLGARRLAEKNNCANKPAQDDGREPSFG